MANVDEVIEEEVEEEDIKIMILIREAVIEEMVMKMIIGTTKTIKNMREIKKKKYLIEMKKD